MKIHIFVIHIFFCILALTYHINECHSICIWRVVVMTSQQTFAVVVSVATNHNIQKKKKLYDGASLVLRMILFIYFQCKNHISVIGGKRNLSIDKNQTKCEYLQWWCAGWYDRIIFFIEAKLIANLKMCENFAGEFDTSYIVIFVLLATVNDVKWLVSVHEVKGLTV